MAQRLVLSDGTELVAIRGTHSHREIGRYLLAGAHLVLRDSGNDTIVDAKAWWEANSGQVTTHDHRHQDLPGLTYMPQLMKDVTGGHVVLMTRSA